MDRTAPPAPELWLEIDLAQVGEELSVTASFDQTARVLNEPEA